MQARRPRPLTHRSLFRHHKQWGYAFRDKLAVRVLPVDAAWPSYVLNSNKDGFRNDADIEDFREKKTEKYIFLGCSFTAGDGVPNAARFSNIIGSHLKKANSYNAAMPGSGNDQHLQYAEFVGEKLTPDVLVLSPFSGCASRNLLQSRPVNDPLYNTIIERYKPYYTLSGGSLNLHNVPVPNQSIEQRTDSDLPSSNNPRRADIIPDKSFGFKIKRQVDQDRGGVDSEIYEGVHSYGYDLLTALLRRTLKVSRAKRVILMPLPSSTDMLCVREPYFVKFYRDFSKKVGVEFVDIFSVFRSMRAERLKTAFLPIDGHYSEFGHELVASELLEHFNNNR